MRPRTNDGWVLSPRGDLAVFAGPILVAGVLVLFLEAIPGQRVGVPPWAFLLLVVGCDVSHVYATAFRTYLDPEERARRPLLYVGVPLACFAVGVALHLVSSLLFWRALAYLAAFHFVRQQVGWMAFAARRAGERSLLDRRLDRAFAYAATVFPLLWWHAHLPRPYDWFLPGDFAPGLPASVAAGAHVAHWVVVGAWLARQGWLWLFGPGLNRGKLLVAVSTWLAWYGGIVLLESDLAFTASNVLAHGVPYLAVIHRYGSSRWDGVGSGLARLFRPEGFPIYVVLLVAAAGLEEWGWDRLVWDEHGSLFPGPFVALAPLALSLVVALLAVPQATHYVLDAFLWRVGPSNPRLAERLGFASSPGAPRLAEGVAPGPIESAAVLVARGDVHEASSVGS